MKSVSIAAADGIPEMWQQYRHWSMFMTLSDITSIKSADNREQFFLKDYNFMRSRSALFPEYNATRRQRITMDKFLAESVSSKMTDRQTNRQTDRQAVDKIETIRIKRFRLVSLYLTGQRAPKTNAKSDISILSHVLHISLDHICCIWKTAQIAPLTWNAGRACLPSSVSALFSRSG